jgi:hypothetical protein
MTNAPNSPWIHASTIQKWLNSKKPGSRFRISHISLETKIPINNVIPYIICLKSIHVLTKCGPHHFLLLREVPNLSVKTLRAHQPFKIDRKWVYTPNKDTLLFLSQAKGFDKTINSLLDAHKSMVRQQRIKWCINDMRNSLQKIQHFIELNQNHHSVFQYDLIRIRNEYLSFKTRLEWLLGEK